MVTPVIFGLGVLSAPVIYAALRKLDQAVGAFIGRREKYAAGHFVRIMEGRLDSGKRTSCRPLLSLPPIRGRACLLMLFKEGPNEPTAERAVREAAPFTEPLDDEAEPTPTQEDYEAERREAGIG